MKIIVEEINMRQIFNNSTINVPHIHIYTRTHTHTYI